jgi:fluoride ion exporter CrcB/FEX
MPVSLAVALGGALGAFSRYTLDRLIEQRHLRLSAPLGGIQNAGPSHGRSPEL